MVDDSGIATSTDQLGAFAGELLGDYSADPLPDLLGAPDAGTPPLPESPETTEPVAVPEGDVPVEPASPPLPDAPDAPAPDAAPATLIDPETAFATEPALTYTVNGVAQTYDGIRVVDGAGYIPPSHLADIQRRLGERDHLFTTNQTLYARTKQYDGLSHTSGPKGQEKEYRGVDAFVQLKADAEANASAAIIFMDAIKEAFPGQENAAAVKALMDRAQTAMELAALKTAGSVRQGMTVQTQQADVPANRERLFQDNFATAKANLKHLTDADITEARAIYGPLKTALYRAATAEDARKYGFTVGEEIYDPSTVNAWLTVRDTKNQQAAVVAASTKAATALNANRLATAVKPVTTAIPPRPRDSRGSDKDQRVSDADEAWDLRERLASARLMGTR